MLLLEEPETPEGNSTPSSQQGHDWSSVWQCFEFPQLLLAEGGGLSRSMQDLVRNAVSEMRRYYSRKVIDVLIKVTRTSLDTLRKRFNLSQSRHSTNILGVKSDIIFKSKTFVVIVYTALIIGYYCFDSVINLTHMFCYIDGLMFLYILYLV